MGAVHAASACSSRRDVSVLPAPLSPLTTTVCSLASIATSRSAAAATAKMCAGGVAAVAAAWSRQRCSCSAPYSGSGRHGLSASSDGPHLV